MIKICLSLLYPQSYLVLLVVDLSHRPHSWIRLLISSLLRKEGNEALMSLPAEKPLGPVSEIHIIFISRDLPSSSMG